MKIFVVNLPENTARLVAIERQLQALNLAYEILPAIRGKSLTSEERQRDYDQRRGFRTYGRTLSSGELGCALSHIAIYRKVAESNITHALVLEDDAWLNPNIPQLLEAIEKQYTADQANIFLLSWASAVRQPYRRIWAGYGLQPVRTAQCAHAYVISRSAATELLQVLYPVHIVADCWEWIIKHGVARVFALTPPAVTSDLSNDSDIGLELQEMISSWTLWYRTYRKVSRVWWKLMDEVIAVGHRLSNP